MSDTPNHHAALNMDSLAAVASLGASSSSSPPPPTTSQQQQPQQETIELHDLHQHHNREASSSQSSQRSTIDSSHELLNSSNNPQQQQQQQPQPTTYSPLVQSILSSSILSSFFGSSSAPANQTATTTATTATATDAAPSASTPAPAALDSGEGIAPSSASPSTAAAAGGKRRPSVPHLKTTDSMLSLTSQVSEKEENYRTHHRRGRRRSVAPENPALSSSGSTSTASSGSVVSGRSRWAFWRTCFPLNVIAFKLGRIASRIADTRAYLYFIYFWILLKSFVRKHSNYYRVHLAYICTMAMFGGLVVYGLERDNTGIPFIDALYLSVSAITQTGLATCDFAAMKGSTQAFVAFIIISGSGTLLTIVPIHIRKRYFQKQLRRFDILSHRKEFAEYNALKALTRIVPIYVISCQVFIFLMLFIYTSSESSAKEIVDRNNQTAFWFSCFHAISAYQNAGFSTLTTNLMDFTYDSYVLFFISIAIILGNTAFPLMMRGICIARYWTTKDKAKKETYKFLIDHPRRCYTHLFPKAQNRWLIIVFVSLNMVQFLSMIAYEWRSNAFSDYSVDDKLSNCYFTAISTRTAGFNSLDLSLLAPGELVMILVMMYISSSPIAIAVRQSGIDDLEESRAEARRNKETLERDVSGVVEERVTNSTVSTVNTQARRVMIQDVFFLFIALLAIVTIETPHMIDFPLDYTYFKAIFEIVSAYGTVGLTLGLPGRFTFSDGMFTGSKFVIICVMILGRHRGLPDAIDRAVQVPRKIWSTKATPHASEVESEPEAGSDASGSYTETDGEGSSYTDVSSAGSAEGVASRAENETSGPDAPGDRGSALLAEAYVPSDAETGSRTNSSLTSFSESGSGTVSGSESIGSGTDDDRGSRRKRSSSTRRRKEKDRRRGSQRLSRTSSNRLSPAPARRSSHSSSVSNRPASRASRASSTSNVSGNDRPPSLSRLAGSTTSLDVGDLAPAARLATSPAEPRSGRTSPSLAIVRTGSISSKKSWQDLTAVDANEQTQTHPKSPTLSRRGTETLLNVGSAAVDAAGSASAGAVQHISPFLLSTMTGMPQPLSFAQFASLELWTNSAAQYQTLHAISSHLSFSQSQSSGVELSTLQSAEPSTSNTTADQEKPASGRQSAAPLPGSVSGSPSSPAMSEGGQARRPAPVIPFLRSGSSIPLIHIEDSSRADAHTKESEAKTPEQQTPPPLAPPTTTPPVAADLRESKESTEPVPDPEPELAVLLSGPKAETVPRNASSVSAMSSSSSSSSSSDSSSDSSPTSASDTSDDSNLKRTDSSLGSLPVLDSLSRKNASKSLLASESETTLKAPAVPEETAAISFNDQGIFIHMPGSTPSSPTHHHRDSPLSSSFFIESAVPSEQGVSTQSEPVQDALSKTTSPATQSRVESPVLELSGASAPMELSSRASSGAPSPAPVPETAPMESTLHPLAGAKLSPSPLPSSPPVVAEVAKPKFSTSGSLPALGSRRVSAVNSPVSTSPKTVASPERAASPLASNRASPVLSPSSIPAAVAAQVSADLSGAPLDLPPTLTTAAAAFQSLSASGSASSQVPVIPFVAYASGSTSSGPVIFPTLVVTEQQLQLLQKQQQESAQSQSQNQSQAKPEDAAARSDLQKILRQQSLQAFPFFPMDQSLRRPGTPGSSPLSPFTQSLKSDSATHSESPTTPAESDVGRSMSPMEGAEKDVLSHPHPSSHPQLSLIMPIPMNAFHQPGRTPSFVDVMSLASNLSSASITGLPGSGTTSPFMSAAVQPASSSSPPPLETSETSEDKEARKQHHHHHHGHHHGHHHSHHSSHHDKSSSHHHHHHHKSHGHGHSSHEKSHHHSHGHSSHGSHGHHKDKDKDKEKEHSEGSGNESDDEGAHHGLSSHHHKKHHSHHHHHHHSSQHHSKGHRHRKEDMPEGVKVDAINEDFVILEAASGSEDESNKLAVLKKKLSVGHSLNRMGSEQGHGHGHGHGHSHHSVHFNPTPESITETHTPHVVAKPLKPALISRTSSSLGLGLGSDPAPPKLTKKAMSFFGVSQPVSPTGLSSPTSTATTPMTVNAITTATASIGEGDAENPTASPVLSPLELQRSMSPVPLGLKKGEAKTAPGKEAHDDSEGSDSDDDHGLQLRAAPKRHHHVH